MATPAAAATEAAPGHTRQDFQALSKRYEDGLVTSEPELVRLAELTQAYDDARRAAELLENEIRAGRVTRAPSNMFKLGDMWLLVREWHKARSALRTIPQSPFSAPFSFKLARTWFEQENWEHAEAHLHRTLSSKGLHTPCRARLLLGHTIANRADPKAAVKEYRRAARSKDCKPQGRAWAAYVRERGSSRVAGAGADEPVPASTRGAGTSARPAAAALNACQTGLFELSEDQMAFLQGQIAQIGALSMGNPKSLPFQRKLGQVEFEDAYLAVLARLNAGALARAQADLAATEEARRLAAAKQGSPPSLLSLLTSCADLHRQRIHMLERAQKMIGIALRRATPPQEQEQ